MFLEKLNSNVFYKNIHIQILIFLGVLPDTVIEHDIDPIVDLDTAHERLKIIQKLEIFFFHVIHKLEFQIDISF